MRRLDLSRCRRPRVLGNRNFVDQAEPFPVLEMGALVFSAVDSTIGLVAATVSGARRLREWAAEGPGHLEVSAGVEADFAKRMGGRSV